MSKGGSEALLGGGPRSFAREEGLGSFARGGASEAWLGGPRKLCCGRVSANSINRAASHSFYVVEVLTVKMEQLINRFLSPERCAKQKFSRRDAVFVKKFLLEFIQFKHKGGRRRAEEDD